MTCYAFVQPTLERDKQRFCLALSCDSVNFEKYTFVELRIYKYVYATLALKIFERLPRRTPFH